MKTTFKPPFNCKICDKKLKSNKSRSQHLIKKHNIQPKDYYDKYLKTEGEGICKTCEKEITWKAGKGYFDYCSSTCAMKDPLIYQKVNNKESKLKKHKTLKNKPQSIIDLETQKRIKTNLERYGVSHQMQRPEIKLQRIQTTINRYGVHHTSCLSSVQEKRLKNQADFFVGKLYILPSGKKIYVLGYENIFLDHVFQNKLLDEKDFNFKKKGYKYKEGNNVRYYYPDFYIPKYNLIVEIKSTYVMEKLQGIKNCLLKENTIKKAGYNYILILDNNFEEFEKFIKN